MTFVTCVKQNLPVFLFTHHDDMLQIWKSETLQTEYEPQCDTTYGRPVISKSKEFSEILRDIRTSTYQICSIEGKTIEQPHFINEHVNLEIY